MPPHTTLHYTMPPNTTNSKSTATTANNGTTQMNTNNKSASTPTTKTTSRQGRSTSASSYIFAPSWLTNLNNKSGSPTTVLNSAYVSTSEEKSVKEEVKGVGVSKKEGLGGIRHAKEGLGKDSSSSFNRSSANGISPLSSIRSKSRDLSGSRLSAFGETENHESPVKIHGRSRSVSQVNQSTISSSNFDKNFPTLAKKKQIDLSVDLPAKNVENIWANSDTKSKLLSPTCTAQSAEENTKFNIPNIDNEPELEKFKSLVPKVEKRGKRKIIRSLSVDSARGPSVFGFGVGMGISNGRSLGQSQNARPYLRDTAASKSTSVQPQRQRAASISTSNGIKKVSSATSRFGVFGQSTITGRKPSIGSNPKYLWSNNTMGKMGYFKIFPEEEEEEDDDDDDELLNDRKEDVINHCDHIEEEEEDDESVEENVSDNNKDVSIKDDADEIIDSQNVPHSNIPTPSPPISSSIEREENFLLQLGWQKPYNNDVDSDEWAITDEEKRFFVNLIRALNGISISERNESNTSYELSYSEINQAKKKWAALVKNIKNINGGNKIFNVGSQSNVAKHVTFDDENGRNNY